jgi:hypothetical protein
MIYIYISFPPQIINVSIFQNLYMHAEHGLVLSFLFYLENDMSSKGRKERQRPVFVRKNRDVETT